MSWVETCTVVRHDEGDIVVDGGSVAVRAEKADNGGARVYHLRATATDVAGNTRTAAGTCGVPHSAASDALPARIGPAA